MGAGIEAALKAGVGGAGGAGGRLAFVREDVGPERGPLRRDCG